MASEVYQYNGPDFSLSRDGVRFVLPAKFRKTVKESSGNRPILCLAQHHKWPCLTGFGASRGDNIAELLAQEAQKAKDTGQEFDYDTREMQLSAFDKVPFDESGRFVLPGYLVEIGDVKDELYFQGSGQLVLIWSPKVLYAMEGPEWRLAQAACRELSAKAHTKADKA
jgi:MraZ protein